MLRHLAVSLAVLFSLSGCAVFHLAGYAVAPDYPTAEKAESLALPGLKQPVQVTVFQDGRYRIEAANNEDLYRATGYLQAKDRFFQMDLLRHMAAGRMAEMVGNVPFGEGTALDFDKFNRFIGFQSDAQKIFAAMTETERAEANAFAAGINHWIHTGTRSLEHRLLGAQVEDWTPEHSVAIFRVIMFGMTHNYSRELRRLVIACDAGVDAVNRIWPIQSEFGPTFLAPEHVRTEKYPLPPAIVKEMRDELPSLCPPKEKALKAAGEEAARGVTVQQKLTRNFLIRELYMPLTALRDGLNSSNNWAVSGSKTKSGKPIFENDPHLPHMNPPLAWGVQQVTPDRNIVGFTIPGVHLVVFGHNHHVAWGATINNVDLQDLYVEKEFTGGYEFDKEIKAYDVRTEAFQIKGADPVTLSVRYTVHGPLINDLEPAIAHRIPPTSLRTVDLENSHDAAAIRGMGYAKDTTEFLAALSNFDSACISWTFATVGGDIGYSSPCRVPVRKTWWGTFPVPGWLSEYEWKGYVDKKELPLSINPQRGWIATANNQAMPFDRFPTSYNTDPAPPNRYLRIGEFLESHSGLTVDDMSKFALDTGESYWAEARKTLPASLCGTPAGEPAGKSAEGDARFRQAAAILCEWDGMLASNSVGATLFVLLSNAMLDRALADELTDGADGKVWHYLQSIPHFEINVDWMWRRPAGDPVWDDVRTPAVESREEIIVAALHEAVALAGKRYGSDMAAWQWGTVRPFFIKHPFGAKGGMLGSLFNGASFPGMGGPETVFKNQFSRSDRTAYHPGAGPAFRLVVDLGALDQSGFSLAGGASGWPKSPHYGDLTADWMTGTLRPLTPAEGASTIRFVPAE